MDGLRLFVCNRLFYLRATGSEVREELVNMLPHFGSARETAPVHADKSYEMEALVDRNNVILVGSAHAVDKESLHVGFHFLEGEMLGSNLSPGFEA
jgi:hypothetical protein